MKLIAFLFLSIFFAVQALPAIQSFCVDTQNAVFTPDEEKGSEEEKTDNIEEDKDKKTEYPTFAFTNFYSLAYLSNKMADNSVEELPAPIIDKITPPPNVSC